eukprot:GFUD01007943.1.p1 GENE.GFUD01007943.1~~GFUD01007943.1.p1  ORF type:complete len:315 (+),score=77.29 GFUD01007943.1:37-945(+)
MEGKLSVLAGIQMKKEINMNSIDQDEAFEIEEPVVVRVCPNKRCVYALVYALLVGILIVGTAVFFVFSPTANTTHTTTTTTSESQNTAYALLARGEAAEYHGDVLGIYDPVIDTGNTIYQQRGGAYSLYQVADGDWVCSDTVGSEDGYLYTSDLNNKGDMWTYLNGGQWVNDDSTVMFTTLSSPEASCLICTTIRMSSTGLTMTAHPQSLGIYNTVPGMFSAGRPVYRSYTGYTMKIKPDDTGYTNFDVFNTADNLVVYSASAPTCPTLAKAAYSAMDGDTWTVWVDGEWEYDTGLVVTCEE